MRGADLVEKFEHHLEVFKDEVNLQLTTSGVTKIEPTGATFSVVTGDGKQYSGKAVIIAGGKLPRKLGVAGEAEYLNKGVTYCAWCDGPLFAGKDVAVIGGGNAALDSALNVANSVKQVFIVSITPELTADPIMVEKVQQAANIRIINNAETKAIKGGEKVTAVTFHDKQSGIDKDLPVEGVFIEVGSIPATDYLKGTLELDEGGEIVIDKNNMSTVPGIFAAGDITTVSEKQIVIAAGEGAKAAICASQYLAKKPN